MEFLKRIHWQQVILAFLLGSVFTAAIIRGRPLMHAFSGKGDRYHRMVEKFSSRLELTPEQKTKVAAILEAKREKIQSLKNDMDPKFEEIRNAARNEIKAILEPHQHAKFEKLDAEMKERREKWKKRWDSKGK